MLIATEMTSSVCCCNKQTLWRVAVLKIGSSGVYLLTSLGEDAMGVDRVNTINLGMLCCEMPLFGQWSNLFLDILSERAAIFGHYVTVKA